MAVNNHHASAILLEKKPKQRRWMTKKARPRKWSQEEDSALSAAVAKFGAKNWKHIAQFVPSRNHTQCLQRWGKVLAPDLVKGHWTQPEDDQLVRLVKELAVEGAVKSWGEVANHIAGRTSKQCRERWFNHLDPSIKRGNYTQNEDKIIMDEQAKLGNKWSIISSMLPGRTEDAVKIRWKTLDRERRQAANGGKLSSTPKKPRRPRKQKSCGNNAQQPPNNQYLDMMSGMGMGPMGMMAPAFPISDGVRRMMNANATTNGYAPGAHGHAPPQQQQQQHQAPYGGGVPPAGGLKVETGLPDQFFDWTQQMSWHNYHHRHHHEHKQGQPSGRAPACDGAPIPRRVARVAGGRPPLTHHQSQRHDGREQQQRDRAHAADGGDHAVVGDGGRAAGRVAARYARDADGGSFLVRSGGFGGKPDGSSGSGSGAGSC